MPACPQPVALNRRLRGKQAGTRQLCTAPTCQMHRLFQFEELSYLVTSWLDQSSLCHLATADIARLSVVADPEAWRGRTVQLKSRAIRNSQQLAKVLTTSSGRWAFVRSLVFPQCNASTATVRTLRAALPALRSVDLRACTRAGCLRLLKELPDLEEVVLEGCLPEAPVPCLKSLEFSGSSCFVERQKFTCVMNCEMHDSHDVLENWRKLPELAPNLQVLRVPWLEEDDCNAMSQDMWDEMHEGMFSCRTDDTCLRALEKLKHLKEVDLSGVYTITDAGLRTLAALPKLERLLLKNMGPRITAEGLWHLADGCASLRFLDLGRCLDTGCRPSAGRTSLRQADIDAFRRRRPLTEVLFS